MRVRTSSSSDLASSCFSCCVFGLHWSEVNSQPASHELEAKTLILCLAFAGVKMYQRKSLEAKLQADKKQRSEKKEN
ncbi:Protein FAM165B [Cricetulus griseus]|uniref:Protein FAM165B n=1 Tax=Cricetulus griseus TaxID=10029 RepID=G3GT70_CRIGR|nr:Protein FAM165B [Cricetulus griseus]